MSALGFAAGAVGTPALRSASWVGRHRAELRLPAGAFAREFGCAAKRTVFTELMLVILTNSLTGFETAIPVAFEAGDGVNTGLTFNIGRLILSGNPNNSVSIILS